jgi:hypothetical protein
MASLISRGSSGSSVIGFNEEFTKGDFEFFIREAVAKELAKRGL